MKDKNWKGIGELIGIAAIVGSLIFVGLQMRQDQQIAIAETFSTATEAASNLAMLVGSNSETWKKGLDGGELSRTDEIEFLAMVVAVEAYYVNMYIRFDRLALGPPERLMRSYAYAIYVYPGLRQAFSKRLEFLYAQQESFDDPSITNFFPLLVVPYLDNLDKNPPRIPSEMTYIFW